MNANLQIAVLSLAGLLCLIGFFWASTTERRLKKFFAGRKAKDLEDIILELDNKVKELERVKEKMQNEINLLHHKIKRSIRGLETLRFNPFPDQGSNQSFAIGLLNEEGDGVVISSLYSRERMSVFAKPVKNKKSDYELSAEEKEVLQKASERV